MKLPKLTKKDVAVVVLCIAVPGAVIGGIAYFFLKEVFENVKKTTIKKSKDQKTNEPVARKRNRYLFGSRKR